MNSWFSHFQWWLIDFQLAATLLLGAALLGVRYIRQPAQRVALGWAISLALALLCFAAAIPAWPRIHPTGHIQGSPMAGVEQARPSETLMEPSRGVGQDWRTGISGHPPVFPGPPRQKAGQESMEQKTGPLAAVSCLSRLFVFASATMCLWLLSGMIKANWLCRTAQGASVRLYEQLRSAAGAEDPPPRLLLSSHVPNAVALGIRRPTILLPAAFAELADEKSIRAVLAHEVAHIRNRDLWLLGLVRGLVIVLFPNPLYWAMRDWIRTNQEAWADAVAAENRAVDYVDGLIGWMRHVTASKRVPAAPVIGIWEKPSELSRRIHMLIDQKFTVQTSVARRWRAAAWVLVGATAVSLSLFSVRPASAEGGSPGIGLLQQSYDRQHNASSYVCDITDNIRRQTTPYFRRTLPDGTSEVSTVLSTDPFQIGIQNTQGFWRVTKKEAVNLHFHPPPPRNPQQELLELIEKNPGDITVNVEKQTTVDGADCLLVEAELSDRLTRQLADAFRVEHKASTALKQKPKMDMLQFITKRRLFWIGTADHLLYRFREYDGNRDLLSDISLSSQILNGTIPDEVFALPKDLKTFTPLTAQQFQKHEAEREREMRRSVWHFGDANEESSSGAQPSQTNKP
jgi:beta-lactamase regulating signal transducer with metallopeptidase domain